MNYSKEEMINIIKKHEMEIDYLSERYKHSHQQNKKLSEMLLNVTKQFESAYRAVVNEMFNSLDQKLKSTPRLRMEVRNTRAEITRKMNEIQRIANE